MTFREWAEQYLTERGIWPHDAPGIVDACAASEANEAMRTRWSDQVDGYPPQVLAVLGLSLDRVALNWIDANCPKAWYRPMFVGAKPEEQSP